MSDAVMQAVRPQRARARVSGVAHVGMGHDGVSRDGDRKRASSCTSCWTM